VMKQSLFFPLSPMGNQRRHLGAAPQQRRRPLQAVPQCRRHAPRRGAAATRWTPSLALVAGSLALEWPSLGLASGYLAVVVAVLVHC